LQRTRLVQKARIRGVHALWNRTNKSDKEVCLQQTKNAAGAARTSRYPDCAGYSWNRLSVCPSFCERM
jgi:hypothetical protein